MDRRVRIVGAPRMQLVDGTGIGALAKVACRAGLHPVATHLHVPEERLAEDDGDVPVADVGVEVGGVRNGDRLERSGPRIVVREEILGAQTRTLARRLGRLGLDRAQGQDRDEQPYRQRYREQRPDAAAYQRNGPFLSRRASASRVDGDRATSTNRAPAAHPSFPCAGRIASREKAPGTVRNLGAKYRRVTRLEVKVSESTRETTAVLKATRA